MAQNKGKSIPNIIVNLIPTFAVLRFLLLIGRSRTIKVKIEEIALNTKGNKAIPSI